MKKSRTIIISFIVILVIYVSFVVVDCVRLRNAHSYTKPIITIDSDVTENRATYYGLGYDVSYYVDRYIDINENFGVAIGGTGAYGAEFRLFNKILIWAWVE